MHWGLNYRPKKWIWIYIYIYTVFLEFELWYWLDFSTHWGIKNQVQNFFLTDKDFAQINAALQVWPSKLCLWHFEKAIKTRLADGSILKMNSYNAEFANAEINLLMRTSILFCTGFRSITNCDPKFCPKEFRDKSWK